jgi:hypothetical protein
MTYPTKPARSGCTCSLAKADVAWTAWCRVAHAWNDCRQTGKGWKSGDDAPGGMRWNLKWVSTGDTSRPAETMWVNLNDYEQLWLDGRLRAAGDDSEDEALNGIRSSGTGRIEDDSCKAKREINLKVYCEEHAVAAGATRDEKTKIAE